MVLLRGSNGAQDLQSVAQDLLEVIRGDQKRAAEASHASMHSEYGSQLHLSCFMLLGVILQWWCLGKEQQAVRAKRPKALEEPLGLTLLSGLISHMS